MKTKKDIIVIVYFALFRYLFMKIGHTKLNVKYARIEELSIIVIDQ